MRILVVEDDRVLANYMKRGLQAEQYAVDVVGDGESAIIFTNDLSYELLILDVNLPKLNGSEVLKRLRSQRNHIPVLVLTGRSAVEERVKMLDLGADDYLVKPFSFAELSARVRALLRRKNQPTETLLACGDLQLNRASFQVNRRGKSIHLTAKEFALLEYLMRNSGRCVTRPMILENVWNINFDTGTNVVDVYINYLRKKIDAEFDVKLIRTVRGVGYLLSTEEAAEAALAGD